MTSHFVVRVKNEHDLALQDDMIGKLARRTSELVSVANSFGRQEIIITRA
jgi:hypothetical protein